MSSNLRTSFIHASLWLGMLVPLWSVGTGCIITTEPEDTTGGTGGCQVGWEGCPCTTGGMCNAPYVCNENLNLCVPEQATYLIGVHYWSAHGYGPAYATVRIYIYGQLVYEQTDVELLEFDMWEVATIDWPDGLVTEIFNAQGEPKITPEYKNPFFFSP